MNKPKRGEVHGLIIRSDLKWKALQSWHDLPTKWQAHHDYLDPGERQELRFVMRRGEWYDVNMFDDASGTSVGQAGWSGSFSLSWSTCMVVKLRDDEPSAIIGYAYQAPTTTQEEA